MSRPTSHNDGPSRPPTPIPESVRSVSPVPSYLAGEFLRRGSVLHKDPNANKHIEEALKPEPGNEADYRVPDSKFAFSTGMLNKLINPKDTNVFLALGGLKGLEKGLRTDRHNGLDLNESRLDGEVSFEDATAHVKDDFNVSPHSYTEIDASNRPLTKQTASEKSFSCRRERFGDGRVPVTASSPVSRSDWAGKNMELALFACASISLILSLYQDLRLKPDNSRFRSLWKQDITVLVILCLTGAFNSLFAWYTNNAENSLRNAFRESVMAMVMRSGKLQEVLLNDILVGDVIFVQPGDLVLADGIVIWSAGIRCDESMATGESDILLKTEADAAYSNLRQSITHKRPDPFMISGAKIEDGMGTYLATAVGVNSLWGKVTMSLHDQADFEKHQFAVLWMKEATYTITAILFLVLFIKFLVSVKNRYLTSFDRGLSFLQLGQLCILTLRLSVSFWTPRFIECVRRWWVLPTDPRIMMRYGQVPTQLNKVSTVCIELDALLDDDAAEVMEAYTADVSWNGFQAGALSAKCRSSREQDEMIKESSNYNSRDIWDENMRFLWKTAFLATCRRREVQQDGLNSVSRGLVPFRKALMEFGENKLDCDFAIPEQEGLRGTNTHMTKSTGSPSEYDIEGVVGGPNTHTYFVGHPSSILESCQKILTRTASGRHSVRSVNDTKAIRVLTEQLQRYVSQGLALVGFAYRDVRDGYRGRRESGSFQDKVGSLVFMGLVTLKTRPLNGLYHSLKRCQAGGISVRLITHAHAEFATFIAQQCGVLFPQGTVTSAEAYVALTLYERQQILPRICVLTEVPPLYVRTFVGQLKDANETVMLIGATDLFHPTKADLRFAVAQNRSTMMRQDAQFVSSSRSFDMIPNIILLSRTFDRNQANVEMYSLVMTAVLVLLTFVTASADSSNRSVFTPAALIWMFFLFANLGCLMLAWEPPSQLLWSGKPRPRNHELFSLPTTKNLIVQIIYQLAVVFTLTFGSRRIFGFKADERACATSALVLSTFMWMQLFGILGMFRLTAILRWQTSRGMVLRLITICLLLISIIIMTSMFGNQAFGIRRLRGYEWAISLVLGLMSPVVDRAGKSIPDAIVLRIVPRSVLVKFFQSPITTSPDEGYLSRISDQEEPTKSIYLGIYDRFFDRGFSKNSGSRVNDETGWWFDASHDDEANSTV